MPEVSYRLMKKLEERNSSTVNTSTLLVIVVGSSEQGRLAYLATSFFFKLLSCVVLRKGAVLEVKTPRIGARLSRKGIYLRDTNALVDVYYEETSNTHPLEVRLCT